MFWGSRSPPARAGPTNYQLGLFNDASPSSLGSQASYTLESDGIFDVPLAMTAISMCGSGVRSMSRWPT